MARREGDVTVLLRMRPEEREMINRVFGKGNVNSIAVDLLVQYARVVQRTQPQLGQEVTSVA
jgi:hypothetical protein